MDKNNYLRIVLAISVLGLLFSGYLTYQEFNGVSCQAISILGLPPCVYGFLMYLVVGIIALVALGTER
jgi:uncharacterized membrane protein